MATQGKSKNKENRLGKETSTYLRQHRFNPVDWFPWGEEALSLAKSQDKPILLSVGYAACHWCHVMEHESFEDHDTAALMNESFVNIKVDREERTDIDEIYMKAVQLMVGHGGWPMTVFLTPEGKPFFGGTYFPREDRHGLPGFKRVLRNVASAWKDNRPQIVESSDDLAHHLKLLEKIKGDNASDKTEGEEDLADYTTINTALEKLVRTFDQTWGGFGNAPKFPHTFSLELAMRCAASGSPIKASRKDECLEIVETTLNKMAYGGIHDQIGGGFARYSTDRQWLVPHFEKMLYDNALLARTYFNGFLLTGRAYWLRVAEGILSFVKRELSTADGAFYSSLDADSEGEEGKFYVWTPDEIIDILGDEGPWFNEVFSVGERGNFEHGTSILHLSRSPEELSRHYTRPVENIWQSLDQCAEKLLAAREKRIRPGRDEKVLTSWNSLMISAFVDGYRVTGKEEYLTTALRAAEFILERMMVGDRLMRVWGRIDDQNDLVKLKGYLDDYACFIDALLDLASVDDDPKWLSHADRLCSSMLAHFYDSSEGGFFYTADDHEELVVRPRSHFDGSVPSGTSMAVTVLLKLAALTDKEEYRTRAREVFAIYSPHLTRMPDQFANLLNALDFYLAAPEQVALILPANSQKNSPAARAEIMTLFSRFHPNKVVATAKADSAETRPLFKNKSCKDEPLVYICKNFTCEAPLQGEALKESIKSW